MFDVNDKLTSSQNTEEDALQVFKRAVNNGQTRLALEALVDVIDAIVEVLTDDSEEESVVVAVAEPKKVEVKTPAVSVEVKEEKVETPVDETPASPKKKIKETTADITL
jgi:hypothetical protein